MVGAPGQNTASGETLPPLNITNAPPGLDTKGFLFNHGPGEGQLLNQLERPGGPARGPQAALKFPLSHFKGAWAGNGFNMLWAPREIKAPEVMSFDPPNDNTLIVQLTTEQWTFGPTLGDVLNRGFDKQPDIKVTGLAYLQTVQNVTNTEKGDGSRLSSTFGSGLHFEPGMFLYVPAANHDQVDSIARMASIPHGATINAQGPVPAKTNPDFGGVPGKPDFKNNFILNVRPFKITDLSKKPMKDFEAALDVTNSSKFREPSENLKKFGETITKEVIVNPNKVLFNALSGLDVVEHITFEVSTDLPKAGKITAGGTTNISFLHGELAPPPPEPKNDDPKKGLTKPDPPKKEVDTRLITSSSANARTARMSSRFWIEKVRYEITIPQTMVEGESLQLMPALVHTTHEPPTPKFMITAPPGGLKSGEKVKAVGTQIQYSQVVELEFGTLVWPHVSVATLVPVDAQPFTPSPQTPATGPTPAPGPIKNPPSTPAPGPTPNPPTVPKTTTSTSTTGGKS